MQSRRCASSRSTSYICLKASAQESGTCRPTQGLLHHVHDREPFEYTSTLTLAAEHRSNFSRFTQKNETRFRTAMILLSRTMTSQLTRCLFGCVVCAGPSPNTTWRMWALAKVLHTTCRPLSRTNSVLSGGLVCSIFVAVKTGPHKFACLQRRVLVRTTVWLMLEALQVAQSRPTM